MQNAYKIKAYQGFGCKKLQYIQEGIRWGNLKRQ